MAITNTTTGKIIGCKKDSLTWWHEKAHTLYDNTNRGITFDFWCQSCLIMTVIYLTIHTIFPVVFWKLTALVSCISFLFFYLYEEVWCWKYAFKHNPKE